MFSHVVVGSNDLARSRRFYDALFEAIGGKPGMVDERGRLTYLHDGAMFLVTAPINGETATHANGGTIGFRMADADRAKAWHDAGVANGGMAVEDAPGERQTRLGAMYLAYLRDPDGNKLCGVYRPAT